jgi:hypothetical protein
MNSYLSRLKETQMFLENLDIDHNNNALWEVLHDASWHQTLDWVIWIEHNKKTIKKIIKYQWVTEFPIELKNEINESFLEIITRRNQL